MLKRTGDTIFFEKELAIKSFYSVAGKKEGAGPVGEFFHRVLTDTSLGQDSWESAEGEMQKMALQGAIDNLGKAPDIIFAGDLLNQCIASGYGLLDFETAFMGLYGACSTIGEALILASIMVEAGFSSLAGAVSSSHFCSAERQFRFPLEYGSMRPPTAQWTATASGAILVGERDKNSKVLVKSATLGKSVDLGITDMTNMGAAMAPAARSTLAQFFKDTSTRPSDYDRIFTGDLGYEGSRLLYELLEEDGYDIEKYHSDCGMMIFNMDEKDVNCGGSGCGCSASIFCSYILKTMEKRELRKVLFMPTGAMMSPTSVQQGNSIPGIAHLVCLEIV